MAESREDDHQISGIQRLQPGDIAPVVRADFAGLLIDRKQHRTLEPVPCREQLRQHRQAFFRAIFFITADKYDALAFARPLTACVSHPLIVRPGGKPDQTRKTCKGHGTQHKYFSDRHGMVPLDDFNGSRK